MLVGALMISTFIFAQRHGDHRQSMKTELSLDDAQYASVNEINKKYGEKHRALRQERESEISKILTPEQSKKWETRRASRQETLKTDLSMSDDQFTKFKEASKKFQDQMRELRDSGKADKASVKKIRDEHDAEVKSILKKDQYEKLQLIKKYSRRSHGHHHGGKFR